MRRPGRDIGSWLWRAAAAASRALHLFAPIVLTLLGSTLALAQVIPPSESAGRERFRFETPAPPRARPGGPSVSLPSTTAPPEAKRVHIVVRRVAIVGATVYGSQDFAPLYQDLIGRACRCRRSMTWRSASPPNTAPTATSCRALSCRCRSSSRAGRWCGSRWSKAISRRWSGRSGSAATATSSPTMRARSRPIGRPTSARSSATCCWPTICRG